MDPTFIIGVSARSEEITILDRDDDIKSKETRHRRVRDAYAPPMSAFEQRSGRVVDVGIPIDELRWSQEESTWPLERYWSQLSNMLGVGAIHFTELPDWRSFELDDPWHLNGYNKDRFTRKLFREVADVLGKKQTAYNCLSEL